jgi:superfamily II DNA helicase RecQ
LLALTATAVPRVQQDICGSLLLRNPYVSKQSFDRSNLRYRVFRKSSGGNALSVALEPIISELQQHMHPGSDENVRRAPQSTIIYVSSRAQVDEISSFLRLSFSAGTTDATSSKRKTSMVEAYHAGMTTTDRNRAHTLFLTGQSSVIVATAAFGMGIDKPDIRRIIHFGCPKTMEEYYQQVGRAGRDGYVAECTMYVSESDFDRYKGDFYLGGLTGTALLATKASMAALRSYSFDNEICRRKALLDYFQDVSSFGDRCGTCDNCQNVAQYGKDMYRDFSDLGAMVVLQAVGALKEQGITTIVHVISGSFVDDYRYKSGMTAVHVKNMIQTFTDKLKKKYSQGYYRDMISSLVGKGYLDELTKKTRVNGYERAWTTYQLSKLGQEALHRSLPILLPVSESLRQIERQEEQKRQEVLLDLQSNGIDLDHIPSHEIEQEGGDVTKAYMKWKKFVSSLQTSGRLDRFNDVNNLIQLIERWRSDAAVKFRVAPASVLAEHCIFQIAYTLATMPPGLKLEAKTLESIGVRSSDLHTLIKALENWVGVAQPKVTDLCDCSDREDARMVLAEVFPKQSWPFVVLNKKSTAMIWEQYYVRFTNGENPQSIAANPGGKSGGRPVKVTTAVAHILDALVRGRKVDLRRLEQYLAVPTRKEWEQLKQAEVSTGMDVTGDLNQSGIDGGKFLMKDFLRPIVGSAIADTLPSERSKNDQKLYAMWCDKLRLYSSFRRIGYEPSFHSSGIPPET